MNNYQRLQPLPAKENIQFKLNLSGHEFIFPTKPVTIPADEFFFWPFNLDLGGVKLIYATAQLVCKVNYGEIETFFFAETPGVKAEFVFDLQTLASAPVVFSDVKPSRNAAIKLKTKFGGEIQIVLLDEADSLALQKIDAAHIGLEMPPKFATEEVETELFKPAGVAREIPLSSGKSHIAIAPSDSDFTNAAIWKIKLPAKLDLSLHPILRIHYLGDVARLTLNGKLIADNFYAGREFDLGMNRYAPEIFSGDLLLEILPLRKDAPIFLEPKAKPDFGDKESLVKLQSVEIVH